MDYIITIVSSIVKEGSWIVLAAEIEREVVEDICSIKGRPGEPWDFPLRLEEIEDRELKYIDIRG